MFGVVQEAKAPADDVHESTTDLVWEMLLWSFTALLRNRWPATDWNGRVFSNTYYPEAARIAMTGESLCGDYSLVVWQVAAKAK